MSYFGTGKDLEMSLVIEAKKANSEFENRKAILKDRKERKEISTIAEFDAPLTPTSKFMEELKEADEIERRKRYRDMIYSDEDL